MDADSALAASGSVGERLAELAGATMTVGIFGKLATAPRAEPFSEDDATHMLVTRAHAMGWSSSAVVSPGYPHTDGFGGDLWEMHEAGHSWGDSSAGRVGWWQVGLAERMSQGVPLPVRPLIACVRDVLAQIGQLDLAGVEALLPVHRAGDATTHIMGGRAWFAGSSLVTAQRVRLTVDSGASTAALHAGERLRGHLLELDEQIDAGQQRDAGEENELPGPSAIHDAWLGGAHHRVTLDASVPSWDLDGVAWLLLLTSEALRRSDILQPVGISITASG